MAVRRLEVIGNKPTSDDMRELEEARPKTRGDCVDGIRPCPFISCKFNTYIAHITQRGEVKTPFAQDVTELTVSNCALDYSGATWEEIGEATGVDREAARVTADRAAVKMQRAMLPYR